jgi:hypothetical protein
MQNFLVKISLLISIIGISTLLLLTLFIPTKQIQISDISYIHLNKKIQITGIITNIKNYKTSNFQILTIKNNSKEIKATVNKITLLNKNSEIILIGKPTIYKNSIQIKTEKIILSNKKPPATNSTKY